MRDTDFAYYLTRYFTFYLSGNRDFSENTIKSYRDTFKLLLIYFNDVLKVAANKITLDKIDYDNVVGFLGWLESERKNSASTRNQRLAAIHAFCRYLQIENPDNMSHYQHVLMIPLKKCPQPLTEYLTPEMLKLILQEPDKTTLSGRRDLILLSTLYDTGARVQELCDLKVRNLRLSAPAIVNLTGKGEKTRSVPLMKNTVLLLEQYLRENHLDVASNPDHPLFFNQYRLKMTRGGIAYIINKYVQSAHAKSAMIPEKVTPHVFRHTKAMHLYQSGIPLIYIRDILGHVSLVTTQVYAKIDTELKREALEKAYPEITDTKLPDWNDNNSLMSMLLKL